MNRKVIGYFFVFFLLFFFGFHLHVFLLEKAGILFSFNLEKIYLFLAGYGVLICVNLELLSTVDKVSEQLGFIYLGSLLLKIILFYGSFYRTIFSADNLTNKDSLSILIPIVAFLLAEVFFITKTIQRNHSK